MHGFYAHGGAPVTGTGCTLRRLACGMGSHVAACACHELKCGGVCVMSRYSAVRVRYELICGSMRAS